jgi:hypothetical protein
MNMKLLATALISIALLGCSAAYKAPVAVAKVPIVTAVTLAKTPVTVTKAVINSEKPKQTLKDRGVTVIPGPAQQVKDAKKAAKKDDKKQPKQ